MICPKCGAEQEEENLDCKRCGVIFAKMTQKDFAQSHDRLSTSKSSAEKAKRPISITVICIIGILGTLIQVLLIFFWSEARQVLTQQFGVLGLPYIAFYAMVGLVSICGLWLMKKWAAYAYTGLTVVNLAVQLATGHLEIWSFLIAAIVIFFALKHVAKMS